MDFEKSLHLCALEESSLSIGRVKGLSPSSLQWPGMARSF